MFIVRKKTSKKELTKLAEHFKGYIKVVVDMKKEILAAGADRHFDEEQVLFNEGSLQENLWGGGYDLETEEIDYNSIINLRPSQDNPSRDILSKDLRQKFDKIIRKLFE